MIQYYTLQYTYKGEWVSYPGGHSSGEVYRGIPKLYKTLANARNASVNLPPDYTQGEKQEDGTQAQGKWIPCKWRVVKAHLEIHDDEQYASSQVD